MLDSIQVLLTVVISILTVLLTIIGLAFYQILKEFKSSVERINKILDDTGRITESVAEPIEGASDFLMGLKKGVGLLRFLSKHIKDDDGKKEKKKKAFQQIQESEEDSETLTSEKKRFFLKNGKSLGKQPS